MNVLITEDRPENRETLFDIITDFNESSNRKIETFFVESLEDLKCKLLTGRFDGAIIDNNLDKWTKTNSNHLSEKGYEICSALTEISNFNNIYSQVFLYSGFPMDYKDTLFQTIRKPVGINAIEIFHKEILEPILYNGSIREISLEAFNKYTLSHKISYYKRCTLNKINTNERFKMFAPSLSWSSDLINKNNQAIVGKELETTDSYLHNSVKVPYYQLDQELNEVNKVPSLFWNFSQTDYFHKQNEQIQTYKFKNEFVELFYFVALAKSLSNCILNDIEMLENFTKLVRHDNIIVFREIQCQIIEKMYKEGESTNKIRLLLEKLKEKMGLETVDCFDGTLESFDEHLDNATVRLTSIIDSKKYFYRTFRYSRLKVNGIKNKESHFRYFVSEYQNSVYSYIELQ